MVVFSVCVVLGEDAGKNWLCVRSHFFFSASKPDPTHLPSATMSSNCCSSDIRKERDEELGIALECLCMGRGPLSTGGGRVLGHYQSWSLTGSGK